MVSLINVFSCWLSGKESACQAGDLGSIPGSGRSSGEGNGNPLKYSCLENPMGRGAWLGIVHGVIRVGHNLATTTKSAQLLVHFKSVSINKFTPIHHTYNLYTLGDLVIIQEFRIFNNFLTGF